VAEADFPTEFGIFRIYGFEAPTDGVAEEAVVLKMGEFVEGVPPLVRIHSQCLTGDVFHSLRCDCRAQLEIALGQIAGEGCGLLNKLRAYELQDQGADTVEANQQLGFEADLRGYQMPAAILNFLGVRAVRLMSNNPAKIKALEQVGVRVAERIPSIIDPIGSTENYLRTKREKMGHLLD